MNFSSRLLENAVAELSRLPGVGPKTALRLALHLLRQDAEEVSRFSESIRRLKSHIKTCFICGNYSDADLCPVCSSKVRDTQTICVVQDTRDVMAIENTAQYTGLYHVLGGLISPMDGIGPSDLRIEQLILRVAGTGQRFGAEIDSEASEGAGISAGTVNSTGTTGDSNFKGMKSNFAYKTTTLNDSANLEEPLPAAPVREVIMALSATMEGDTTLFYLYKKLKDFDVKLSTIAKGISFGGELEYVDEVTLGRSILSRVPYENTLSR